jgi:ATP-dependent exoDNAse (exonuclease V) alpha subunit
VTRENTIPLEVGRRKEIKQAFAAGTGPDPVTMITDDGKGRMEIVGTIAYMPMRAAYGCTVHKTQGLTLDNVQVNIRDWFFKTPGMLFVALSRARTAEGLRIVGDQQGFIKRCCVEPRVQPWL